jgi:hypothetical protein
MSGNYLSGSRAWIIHAAGVGTGFANTVPTDTPYEGGPPPWQHGAQARSRIEQQSPDTAYAPTML